jgi:hypothetical protein
MKVLDTLVNKYIGPHMQALPLNRLLELRSRFVAPGPVDLKQRPGDEAPAIGVALVISTWVGLASAALTMAWLMKRAAPPQQKDGP